MHLPWLAILHGGYLFSQCVATAEVHLRGRQGAFGGTLTLNSTVLSNSSLTISSTLSPTTSSASSTLPLGAAASATSVAQSATSAAALYVKSPTAENAQFAQQRIEAAAAG